MSLGLNALSTEKQRKRKTQIPAVGKSANDPCTLAPNFATSKKKKREEMRLLQHTKYHKPAHANYAYDYIKWSERNGRHVGKIERHFITALEYKRVVLQ